MIGKREAREFFAARSPSVRKRGLTVDSLTDDQMRALMLEEPRLLRRPLLRIGRRVLVGFNESAWREALPREP